MFDESEIISDRQKACSACHIVKEATDFSVGTSYRLLKGANDVKKILKLNSVCKKCMSARTKKWKEENRERYQTYQALYKRQLRRQLKHVILPECETIN